MLRKDKEDFNTLVKQGSVKRSDKAIWRNVEGRGIILNPKTDFYYTVEGTALRIWELIDTEITISELASLIADEYTEDEQVVKKDLIDILALMKKEGIIELCP